MKRLRVSLLSGILFLFLFQLLSDFFESIYAFGLLVTRFTPEAVSVLLIFAPLVLLFFKRGLRRPALLALGLTALICRVVEPLLALGGRMVLAGLGTAALLIFFPAWLAGRKGVSGGSLGPALTLALALSILFNTLGAGTDWSVIQPLAGIALALAAIPLLFRADLDPAPASTVGAPASFIRLAGLAEGVAAVFLMIYFAFANPAVIARWTGFSFMLILSMLVVILVLFSAVMGGARFTSRLTSRVVLVWNALFVLALALTILPHQFAFPADPAAYPFDSPTVSPLAVLPFLVTLLLSPVIVVDLTLFARALLAEHPSTPQLGGAFGLASLFFLVMVFFHVFTTIYDYAPVIGPVFRDRFWFVYLLAGLSLALPVLLVRRESFDIKPFEASRPFIAGLGLVAMGTILAAGFTEPRPPIPGPTEALRVMTYNIQQGFDAGGRVDLEGQLAVIRRVDPDVLGLQESDTARIANGNRDSVRYFAANLNMYSYYGPSTTTGTFGIALLSKYPIEDARTFFMQSIGEQTAAIQAKITANGRTYRVFVTHLGNGGPMIQLQNVLERIQGMENVIIMGDFNFEQESEQYRLITSSLSDSWLLRWPDGRHSPGADLPERIDYIFVSPGTVVSEAEYMPDRASDHPSLYAVVRP
jgi:endonuclease/exonuclease/phosphatase family metal-dependent hydrolase